MILASQSSSAGQNKNGWRGGVCQVLLGGWLVVYFLNKGFILILPWYVLLSVPLRPEDTWLASPLNTKQNTFAEHAASSAAFTSLTFAATPTLPRLSRARAQTVTALGSFSRVPLELLPSPWLPGVATSPLSLPTRGGGRGVRTPGTRAWGCRGIQPQECHIPAGKQQFGKG